jgi:hypothetical protein
MVGIRFVSVEKDRSYLKNVFWSNPPEAYTSIEYYPMIFWNSQSDRRQHPRFRVQGDAVVVLKSYPPTMGKIIDISRDGLSFRYIHNLEWLNQTHILDIFQAKGRFYLGRAEFTTVSNAKISDFVRRLSVRFNGLNRGQKKRLDRFIEKGTIDSA